MADKTIRIWSGCKVLQVVSVGENGGSTTLGATGGADSSTRVDIEIDPFAGTIVDHSVRIPPQAFREDAQDAGGTVDLSVRGALLAMLEILDGWIDGAKGNHEALGHRAEPPGEECWRRFSPEDIRNMIRDAARELGVTLAASADPS